MFDKLKVEKKEGEAVVTGELTLDFLAKSRPEALKALNARLNVPGFRAGNIPEYIIIKQIGEMHVLEEVAEVALAHAYGDILKETKLTPIGRPAVSITKLAPGIPLEFKITLTLEPEFDLPDYKKIGKVANASVKEDLNVTETEIDAVLEEIKKQGWDPHIKEGENLRDKVKENLAEEKKFRTKEMKRLKIVEELTKETKVKIPELLVNSELEKMVGQFKDDVERHKMIWNEYLKSIKKTEDDLRAEWKDKAENRAKAELIIAKIAEAEKLEPKVEELEHETAHMLSHHKDADPLRLRLYVYQMLRTQKVFEFLETL